MFRTFYINEVIINTECSKNEKYSDPRFQTQIYTDLTYFSPRCHNLVLHSS